MNKQQRTFGTRVDCALRLSLRFRRQRGIDDHRKAPVIEFNQMGCFERTNTDSVTFCGVNDQMPDHYESPWVWCLLVATDDYQTPLAWQWCSTESQAAWEALLRKVPAPLVVICDGGSGVRAAIREQWPDTLTQRCIFHVWMNLRTHLTLRPRTPAGQMLLEIGKRLRQVQTTDEAVAWLQNLNDWHTLYGHLTKERSYAKRRLPGGLWDSPTGKQWWYTHDRLRRAYNLLTDLQRRDHLFTYLQAGGPKTTSRLEGGVNAAIKQTLRLHRGMTIEHQRRAAEWVLIERAGLLHTADEMIGL